MSSLLHLAPLGELLVKSEEWTAVEPHKRYQEITVRLWAKGVVPRGEVSALEIAAGRRLVARSGQFILSRIDARNGAFGLVPASLDGALISNDFQTFNVNQQRLLPSFLGWLSKTRTFWELCRTASEGTTNRVRLVKGRFLAIEIQLPPLEEQRRIVARIEGLAAKIEEARYLRQGGSDEVEALHAAWLRFAIQQCEAEVIGLEQACEAIVDNLHSNPQYVETGIPCVRSPDVGWGTLNLSDALRTEEEEYRRRTARGEPQADDIVFVREGGGTGKSAIVLPGQRFSLGQRVMMLRPDKRKVLPRFFLYQLLSPLIQQEQIGPLCKGSASPHLNISSLRCFRFRLPPISEQHRIVAQLDALQAKVDSLKRLQDETAAELDALLPSILDKAFKGEL